MAIDLEKKRLIWQCRRGMLELDILLENFLFQQYDDVDLHWKILFKELLVFSDQELFVWLTGRETPGDEQLHKLVEMIRGVNTT